MKWHIELLVLGGSLSHWSELDSPFKIHDLSVADKIELFSYTEIAKINDLQKKIGKHL